jgi:hypothetical protein
VAAQSVARKPESLAMSFASGCCCTVGGPIAVVIVLREMEEQICLEEKVVQLVDLEEFAFSPVLPMAKNWQLRNFPSLSPEVLQKRRQCRIRTVRQWQVPIR